MYICPPCGSTNERTNFALKGMLFAFLLRPPPAMHRSFCPLLAWQHCLNLLLPGPPSRWSSSLCWRSCGRVTISLSCQRWHLSINFISALLSRLKRNPWLRSWSSKSQFLWVRVLCLSSSSPVATSSAFVITPQLVSHFLGFCAGTLQLREIAKKEHVPKSETVQHAAGEAVSTVQSVSLVQPPPPPPFHESSDQPQNWKRCSAGRTRSLLLWTMCVQSREEGEEEE